MKKLMPGILLIIAVNMVCAMQPSPHLNSSNNIDSILEKIELIPLMITGEKDNRINIVIMNRWTSGELAPYNTEEMKGEFVKDINESLIAALTPGDERAQTAYANYREFFNVYGLWYPETPEWDKGINGKIVDAIRDSLFLPWANEHTGWVTFLVMPNLNKGGGGASRNLEARVGRALIAGKGIGKMLHEIAHTCMSIGDEYTAGATGTSANPTYNNAMVYKRDEIKWRKWIDADTPLPTPYQAKYRDKIGAFEGTQYHLTDYYRSTAQGCIMGAGVFDNTEKMCPICEQRVAMRVNKLVNPINSFTPTKTTINIEGKTKLHFEIDHIKPIPNTQIVRWVLNGKTVATNVDKIDIELGEIAEYNLKCSLIDQTPFIRPDPPYGKYPTREINWKILNASPSSKATNLAVKVQSSYHESKQAGPYSLSPILSGGKPPFTFSWSTGSTAKVLEEVDLGIYDLVITDSEFRTVKTHYSLSEREAIQHRATTNSEESKKATTKISLDISVKAADMDQANGKIAVVPVGGSKPYHFSWTDYTYEYSMGRIYEAEEAVIDIPGHTVEAYFDASNNAFIQFNEKEGSITWTVEVARSGYYPLDIIYAGISRKEIPMDIIVNGERAKESLLCYATRPLFTGWEKTGGSYYLKEGENQVSLISKGKSGANIDYLSVPTAFKVTAITGNERINLSPGDYTVVVTDGNNHSMDQTIRVPAVYPFQIENLELESPHPGSVSIVNPLSGYTYQWYAHDVSPFISEKYEKALHTGTEFTPSTPGNYYVAAKNKLTNAESKNRISFAVADASKTYDSEAINPSSLSKERIKLWFDSNDLDGDGKEDLVLPARGPLRQWKEKTRQNPGKLFAKYEPNRLNGKGVCAFDNVWVSDLGKKVSNFQTIIMVYKESNMTFAGTGPFRDLNKYLGKSSNTEASIFDRETIDDKTTNGKVYLNGKQVDPFTTANPMDYCILTIEFASVIKDSFSRFEGLWQGEIAEMIFIEDTLSESERKGVEKYLHEKWFTAVSTEK